MAKELTTAEAITELARQLKPQGIWEQAGFSPEKVAQMQEPPKALRWRKVACKSDETGATFTACVTESRAYPNGRITALENYTHPPGVATFVSAGGLVPDGFQILKSGTAAPPEGGPPLLKQDLTVPYLQWRWVEFWQKDLRRLIGKPLLSSHAIDPAAWATPWQEGRVGQLE